MPVCCCTACAKSESVKRLASSSWRAMRPVKATGWKLMPLVQSIYSSASRTMSPIWWSLSPFTMVGTNTIFSPALRTFSMHFNFRSEAAGAVDILERQPHDVADLVVVEPLHDGGDEHDLQPGLADVFNALQLLFPQPLAARAAVDVVADAVELQVERVQAGFLAQ